MLNQAHNVGWQCIGAHTIRLLAGNNLWAESNHKTGELPSICIHESREEENQSFVSRVRSMTHIHTMDIICI